MLRPLLLLLAALLAPAVAAQIAPVGDSYVIGANDELRIALLGRPDPPLVTRVREDGTVVLPLLGPVRAAGATRQQLAAKLASAYKAGGYYVNPSVGVDLVGAVSAAVTVFGAVQQPGVVPLDRPTTLAMAVATARGALPDAADYAVLRPAGSGPERRIYFDDLGGAGTGTPLHAGDTVFVPESAKVFVTGQVTAGGAFRVVRGMTVRQALARAGGVTLAGTEKRVSLFRDGQEQKKVSLDAPVQDKDVVRVGERLF